jgi:hypothetical protein
MIQKVGNDVIVSRVRNKNCKRRSTGGNILRTRFGSVRKRDEE